MMNSVEERVVNLLKAPGSRKKSDLILVIFPPNIEENPSNLDHDLIRNVISRLSLQYLLDSILQCDDIDLHCVHRRFFRLVVFMPEIAITLNKSEAFWSRLNKLSQGPEPLGALTRCFWVATAQYLLRHITNQTSGNLLNSRLLEIVYSKTDIVTPIAPHLPWTLIAILVSRVDIDPFLPKLKALGVDSGWGIIPPGTRPLSILFGELFAHPERAKDIFKSRKIKFKLAKKCCHTCGKKDTKRELKMCGRCRSIFYCNRVCAKKDWKRHKKECKKIKI